MQCSKKHFIKKSVYDELVQKKNLEKESEDIDKKDS